MEEATNIYRSIVGNADNTRTDKVHLLIHKVRELRMQSLQACIKAQTLLYEDAKYLFEYSQRTDVIIDELINISEDYVHRYNFM